jgi:hypothetical protein
MFAALLPLVLSLAPQLAGMIFGSNGETATAKVASVVQSVVGGNVDLTTQEGAAAAVTAIQGNSEAARELQAKLAELHQQMQQELDREQDQARKDALDELKARIGDTGSARDMAVNLANAHSNLAYGGAVLSVIIVIGFTFITWFVLGNGVKDGSSQLGYVLVGTLGAMATQVANYWLGSSQSSNAKNALLANAQNQIAASVPVEMVRSMRSGN